MNRRLQLIIGGIALAIIGVCLVIMALTRVQEARQFGQAHRVRTYGGTNYVARLAETTIGRTESGRVVIVNVVLSNPNPYDIALDRKCFILIDGDKDYFQPSTTGTQTESIKIPAHGIVENELLTYAVDDNSFNGTLGLQVGYQYMVMLKGIEPYTRQLGVGEYRTFHRRDW